MRRTSRLAALVFVIGCGSADGGGAGGGSVASCDLPCSGAHEVCVVIDGEPGCACAAGYEGDPCVWGVVPTDPEFEGGGAWSDAAPGVSIDGTDSGLAPGVAKFSDSAVCNGAVLSQVVTMPSRDVADPFVAVMTFRNAEPEVGTPNPPGVDIYAGRALRSFAADLSGRFVPKRFCLGEAAYGRSETEFGSPVEFRIGAAEYLEACTSTPDRRLEIDRFQILVADEGECPEIGTARNGAAEVGAGDWMVDLVGVLPGLGSAELEPGVGVDGSGGARLFVEGSGSGIPLMGTTLSVPVPETLASPVLVYSWKASEGFPFAAQFGDPQGTVARNGIESFAGDGEWHDEAFCLPPWTFGSVVELWYRPLNAGINGELVIDDIAIESDPSCGESLDVLDPRFDSAPARWPGVLWGSAGVPDPVKIVEQAPAGSPSSGGAALIEYASTNASISLTRWLWVPRSVGLEGPQLAFHTYLPARAPDESLVPVSTLLGRNPREASRTISGGPAWERQEVCLPPGMSERWLRAQIQVRFLEAVPTPEQLFDPPKQIFLDDFELTTSPACQPE